MGWSVDFIEEVNRELAEWLSTYQLGKKVR